MGNKRKLSTRRASFLKVLRGDFSNKLTIPRAFIENFNEDIPRWFLLEIAGTRKGCRVDTEEDGNGGFYFDYGWNEFVKEQSLQIGDFLLFEYEEPLILEVKIFENDGTEKTPTTNLTSEHEVEGSDCGTQSLETHRVAEADLRSTRPSKSNPNQCEGHKTSQDVTDRIEMETDYPSGMHEKYPDFISKIETETDYGYGVLEKPCDVNGTSSILETDDDCRVHEKHVEIFDGIERGTDKVFLTEHGVCFTIIWRMAHHFYYYLTIPRSIVTRKTLLNDETVILKDREGNSWPVKLRVRYDGRMDLARGWKEFLIENYVKSGDILTLEFVSDKVIQIHIERTTIQRVCPIDPPFERACPIDPPESANKWKPAVSFDNTCDEPALTPVNCKTANHNVPETTRNKERVFFRDSINSTFSMTCTRGNRGGYLHIPKAIATKRKLKSQDTVLLYDPAGAEWPMKVRTRPSDGRVGLAQGWSTFWKQHKIATGDTLNFKFVSNRVMKVNITRALPVHPSPIVTPVSYRWTGGLAVKQEVVPLE